MAAYVPTTADLTARTDECIREAIAEIPTEASPRRQGAWWGTDNGQWLLRRITERIGSPLSKQFSRDCGTSIEPADIAHTAVLVLSRDLARASIRSADDQWAYLYSTLRHELAPLSRTGNELESDRMVDPHSPVETDGVSLAEAVAKTLACLAGVTPDQVVPSLPVVVRYFAEHGDSRLSHLHTLSTRDTELTSLGLSRKEILALANVILGSRPDHGKTSLLGGFLRDAHWDPNTSEPHRRSLNKYQARMLRATTPNPVLEATAV